MSIPRLHCDAPLAEGAEIAATAGQAHYLGAVMRRGPGDALRLFNAREGEFAATLASIRKERAVFAVGARCRAPVAAPDLRLVMAAIKRDALEWTVEKATELGIAHIQPVFTRRSVTERVNTERLTLIAREAAEQCERFDIPTIAPPLALPALLDAWDGAPLLAGVERMEGASLAARVRGMRPPLGWLVGPEGGFDRAELDDLLRHPFVAAASLGPRILRAETAAIAGLALLQAVAGDWGLNDATVESNTHVQPR